MFTGIGQFVGEPYTNAFHWPPFCNNVSLTATFELKHFGLIHVCKVKESDYSIYVGLVEFISDHAYMFVLARVIAYCIGPIVDIVCNLNLTRTLKRTPESRN